MSWMVADVLQRAVRVFLALISVLLGWLLAASVVAAEASASAEHSYAYDSHHLSGLAGTTTGRGPPWSYDQGTTIAAVDGLSNGASARPGLTATLTIYIYNHSRWLVQVAGVGTTTQAQVRQSDGDVSSSFDPTSVAAKSGLGVQGGLNLFKHKSPQALREAGWRDGGLGKGRNAHVRTVGSVDDLQDTFNAWSVGAERLAARGPKVPDVYRLPDGGIIQWRTSSATGGPSIDIFPVSGRQRTVHLADGVPW